MDETLGEALDQGWKLRLGCGRRKRDGMKSARECKPVLEADLETLVWTRGRDFPIVFLGARLKCSRSVLAAAYVTGTSGCIGTGAVGTDCRS